MPPSNFALLQFDTSRSVCIVSLSAVGNSESRAVHRSELWCRQCHGHALYRPSSSCPYDFLTQPRLTSRTSTLHDGDEAGNRKHRHSFRAWPRAGPPWPTVIRIECSADRSLRPFSWPQRTSFTPEALYIVRSCHEQDNKRYSCPVPRVPKACTATRDSTTFMVAKVSSDLSLFYENRHSLGRPGLKAVREDGGEYIPPLKFKRIMIKTVMKTVLRLRGQKKHVHPRNPRLTGPHLES